MPGSFAGRRLLNSGTSSPLIRRGIVLTSCLFTRWVENILSVCSLSVLIVISSRFFLLNGRQYACVLMMGIHVERHFKISGSGRTRASSRRTGGSLARRGHTTPRSTGELRGRRSRCGHRSARSHARAREKKKCAALRSPTRFCSPRRRSSSPAHRIGPPRLQVTQ